MGDGVHSEIQQPLARRHKETATVQRFGTKEKEIRATRSLAEKTDFIEQPSEKKKARGNFFSTHW